MKGNGVLSEPRLSSEVVRARILAALGCAREADVAFVPVSAIDSYLARRAPAVFLKHDVHNVNPAALIDLAGREAEMGVIGTYFFMSFGHPRGERFYAPADQRRMMREVSAMGHEIGAHFDLFYELRHRGKTVRDALREQIESFAGIAGPIRVVNLHGNSRFKMVDSEGNNLIYDFFDELARHSDYPDLRRVPEEFATTIRRERMSLKELDITHWGDSWIWSRANGMIATNLISDNWMGKHQELAVTTNTADACAYGLNPTMEAGVRDGRHKATWVGVGRTLPTVYAANQFRLKIAGDDVLRFFADALPAAPFVMLLHPEFYAA